MTIQNRAASAMAHCAVRLLYCTAIFIAIGAKTTSAQQDPSDPAKRERIAEQLMLSVDEVVSGDTTKAILRYRLSLKGTSRPLVDGDVFIAGRAVSLTYPGYNPLRIQVTADVTSAPDPTYAAVTQLVDALLGTAAILRPDLKIAAETERLKERMVARTASACTAEAEAQKYLIDLADDLFPSSMEPKAVLAALTAWRDDLDLETGPQAVRKTRDKITQTADVQEELIKKAADHLKLLDAKIEAAKKDLESKPNDPCFTRAVEIYSNARLSRPEVRLEELRAIHRSVQALHASLRPYELSGAWVEDGSGKLTHYVITSIEPSITEMRIVDVKAVRLSFDADRTGLTTSTKTLATAKFTVMRESTWFPEIGLGALVSDFREQKYGTGTNDEGKTIVKKTSVAEVSLDPAVVGNFLLPTNGNVVPMVQIGAVPAPSSPGYLVGVGFRFRKPKVGFAVGWAHLWLKDLVGLAENDIIKGTTDIDEHLKFVAKDRPYVMVQYNFGGKK